MDKLQWGNRKRLRCVKVKESTVLRENKSSDSTIGGASSLKKKITSRVDRCVVVSSSENQIQPHSPLHFPYPLTRDLGMNRKASTSSSPEKEDRYYTTRGSVVGLDHYENGGKVFMDSISKENNISSRGAVWPKLYISLSSKEKEEDFLAMKGCKPPQRPKKRPKLIQRSLLLVSPGAWLSDLCQERYEVREKKTSKKQRPRGLKAMGGMESESDRDQ